MPSYEQVMRNLFSNYFIPNYGNDTNLVFHKKRDGWHVAKQIHNYAEDFDEIVTDQLYWSAEKSGYVPLTLFQPGESPYVGLRISGELEQATPYYYERCPYFGYDGWPLDVIADFGGIKIPENDTVLEGLARSYAIYANGYCLNQHIKNSSRRLSLPDKERCDGYKSYKENAIRCFDLLRKRQPHYAVIVGEISTNYYNDVMDYYDQMLFFHRESEVMKYFNEEFYDPLMIGFAEGMLNNCDKHAILFTYGDNDTYPLWYLQTIKKIRTDVVVICTSLLGRTAYMERYRSSDRKDNAITFSIEQADYEQSNGYFLMYDNYAGRVEPTTFMKDNVGKVFLEDYQQELVTYRPAHLVMHKTKETFTEYNLLPTEDSAVLFLKKPYYSLSEMAILDIVVSNYKERPIYFSIGHREFFLDEFLFNEGLLARFIPAQQVESSGIRGFLRVASDDIFAARMLNSFVHDTTAFDRGAARVFILNYRICMLDAAEYMSTRNAQMSARMIKTCYEYFPLSQWMDPSVDALAASTYYKVNRVAEGDMTSSLVLDSCEARLIRINAEPGQKYEMYEKTNLARALRMIRDSAKSAGSTQISDRAEKIRLKFLKDVKDPD